MSSEISRIDRWTGRFLIWNRMTSPKRMPTTETPMPTSSSVRLA
jgi:hypothetical protein